MLTGAMAPTSGYAVIAGKDIRFDMNQIRQDIGICMQHDCLFPQLTVREHIQFFARLKGLYRDKSYDDAEAEITQAIQDVALLEKSNTLSQNLSGGMKRKLSVAIAFCGGSSVVLLDEPTSGMVSKLTERFGVPSFSLFLSCYHQGPIFEKIYVERDSPLSPEPLHHPHDSFYGKPVLSNSSIVKDNRLSKLLVPRLLIFRTKQISWAIVLQFCLMVSFAVLEALYFSRRVMVLDISLQLKRTNQRICRL